MLSSIATTVAFAGLAIFGLLWKVFMPGEKDSQPLHAPADGSLLEVLQRVIDDLAGRKRDAFCTFETNGNTVPWFQINGADLTQAAMSWIGPGDPIATLRELSIELPSGMEIVENEDYGENYVVLFNCDALSPSQWASFIDDVFRKVHHLAPGYALKGFVVRA